MKISLFACMLLLLTATVAVDRFHVVARASNPMETPASTYLPADSTIKVYFVSGMFSSDQRKALWDAMEHWQSSRSQRGAEIKFVDHGEASGLIDCQSCLTVVREEVYTQNSRRRSSFNRLRQDETGRLISAWIGLDRGTSTTAGLRDLMLKALERGLGV